MSSKNEHKDKKDKKAKKTFKNSDRVCELLVFVCKDWIYNMIAFVFCMDRQFLGNGKMVLEMRCKDIENKTKWNRYKKRKNGK